MKFGWYEPLVWTFSIAILHSIVESPLLWGVIIKDGTSIQVKCTVLSSVAAPSVVVAVSAATFEKLFSLEQYVHILFKDDNFCGVTAGLASVLPLDRDLLDKVPVTLLFLSSSGIQYIVDAIRQNIVRRRPQQCPPSSLFYSLPGSSIHLQYIITHT